MSLFLVAVLAVGFLLFVVILRSMMVYIPNNRVGILEKLISAKGSVRSGLIALEREAGFQPERAARRLALPDAVPVPRPQDAAGHHPAGRDRLRLRPRRPVAAAHPVAGLATCAPTTSRTPRPSCAPAARRARSAWSCARAPTRSTWRSSWSSPSDQLYYLPMDRSEEAVFRQMGQLIGERGGFHPVVIQGADDRIGIVTVHDGPAVPSGEIIAPMVGNDPGARRRPTTTASRTRTSSSLAGGQRGRQLQVLVEGTYYINRLFATERAGAEDRRRGRHRRRRRLLHRRQRRATSRARTTSTASW